MLDSILEPETPAQEAIVELDWFDEGEVVRVCPRDQRRFQIHKDRAIRILQLANDGESQLKLLMDQVGEWVHENAAKLQGAFLTLRDERFYFVAVSQAAECDDDLEDSISDLDFKIAIDPDLEHVRMNAVILPPASKNALSSFFDKRFLMVYRVPGS